MNDIFKKLEHRQCIHDMKHGTTNVTPFYLVASTQQTLHTQFRWEEKPHAKRVASHHCAFSVNGDNAETSTLVSLDIDRQKYSRIIFVGL